MRSAESPSAVYLHRKTPIAPGLFLQFLLVEFYRLIKLHQTCLLIVAFFYIAAHSVPAFLSRTGWIQAKRRLSICAGLWHIQALSSGSSSCGRLSLLCFRRTFGLQCCTLTWEDVPLLSTMECLLIVILCRITLIKFVGTTSGCLEKKLWFCCKKLQWSKIKPVYMNGWISFQKLQNLF